MVDVTIGPGDERHGTPRGYGMGCRQDCCREAMRVYRQNYMATRPDYIPAWVVHGTESTYQNWKCRCPPCKAAKLAGQRARYNRAMGRESGLSARDEATLNAARLKALEPVVEALDAWWRTVTPYGVVIEEPLSRLLAAYRDFVDKGN